MVGETSATGDREIQTVNLAGHHHPGQPDDGMKRSPHLGETSFLGKEYVSLGYLLDLAGEHQLVDELPKLNETAGHQVNAVDLRLLQIDIGAQDCLGLR